MCSRAQVENSTPWRRIFNTVDVPRYSQEVQSCIIKMESRFQSDWKWDPLGSPESQMIRV